MNQIFSKFRRVGSANKSAVLVMTAMLPLLVAFTNCADVSPIADSTAKNASLGAGATPATPMTTVPLTTTLPPGSTTPTVTPPVTTTPVINPPQPVPVGTAPFAYQSTIVLGVPDEFARINTGVSTSEEAYGCMQKNSDSSYPCQNGNIAAKFTLANGILGSTRVWLSPSFYADPSADIGDYTVILMKKNAGGVLSEVIGVLSISIRLPELAPNQYWSESGGAWSSSSGPNKVYASCRLPNVAFQLSAGFVPYPYSGSKECYYKIVR